MSPTYVRLRHEEIDAERVWCQSAHKLPAFRQWERLMRRLRPSLSGRLLDIGCGTGGFLGYAERLGLDTYGFDASQAQAQTAARSFERVRHAEGPREYLRILDERHTRFDFVTLWDVLEHLQDPVGLMRIVGTLLAPDGLVFVSVPNGRALSWKMALARIAGRRVAFVPWEHVCYFTARSLERCMGQAGLMLRRTGAVVCYPRPLSAAEVARRIGFAVLQAMPSRAPQMWGIASRA